MTSESHIKRRTRLIQPSLQIRLIAVFFGLTALALLTQVLVLGTFLSRLAGDLGPSGLRLAIETPTLLWTCLGLSAVMVLPAVAAIGIRVTFRLAGPLYRMEQHLEGIANGEEVSHCTIRDSDELHGFCDTLNRALERVNQGETSAPEAADDDAAPRVAA